MRFREVMVICAFAATSSAGCAAQTPLTLREVLSAPYASSLTAAPKGAMFAWVEDAEGRHNLYVGGPDQPARALTHNTEDDAQDIAELAWSPDGLAIAYTSGAESGADGKPANPAHLQRPTPVQVIVQPLAADAKAIVLGEGRAPVFTPDSHFVLFLRSGQIWMAALGLKCSSEGGGCQLEVVTSDIHQLVFDRGSASSLTLSPDGRTLAFISTRREVNQPAHRFLALFDMATKTLSFPAPSTGNDSAPVFSPDGQHLAWLRSPFTQAPEFAPDRTSPNPWSIQLLDLAAHVTRTIYTPEANKPGSVLPHMARGAPRLFYTASNHIIFSSEADGYVHLYALDPLKPHSATLLTPGSFEVEDPTIDASRHLLFWASNDNYRDPLDEDRRHIWQLNVGYPGEGPKQRSIGSGSEVRPEPAADDSTVAMLVSDPEHPMQAALIDGHGKLTPLHPDATPATYPASSLITPAQILFDSSDGIHLHAQLFLPKKLGPKPRHPAILFFHGGPRRQMLLGYPTGAYYSNAYAMNQYLTSLGFIVLSVNYRCGIGYGLEFRQCLHAGADGASEYADVLAAQKYLASREDVDVKRIGVWGGSYGGYLTALALARNSDLFAAGVDFHGVHDWNLEDNAGDWLVGSAAEKAAIAAKALASSPLADVTHWTSPVLLIHGDNDPDVAYAETAVLADKLRAQHAGLPAKSRAEVEEVIFPDEVHGFLLHQDWLAAYERAAAFFVRTLKP